MLISVYLLCLGVRLLIISNQEDGSIWKFLAGKLTADIDFKTKGIIPQ